jgi:hypothetical protein
MTSVLFSYPKQAQFGRVLPKNKIYQHASPSPAVKALFVQQVEQIVWQYKLAPETVNLPAKPSVPEIQIFDISLKSPELNHEVLRCIDKAIPFPIIFQLHHDHRIQPIATYKRPNDADSSKWVIDGYFSKGWLPEESTREPLPQRELEPLKEHVERIGQWQSKQNEYQKHQSRLNKEKQFNRKVELNAQLRRLKTELEQLAS